MNASAPYYVASLHALDPDLRGRLQRAGYHTVAQLKVTADGALMTIPYLRKPDLLAIRAALGQPIEHLLPKKPRVTPLTTDDALQLLDNYQRCTPLHRDLLQKLASVLATKT